RVPGVEINVQIVQAIKIDKLDFHRVCLQSETFTACSEGFFSCWNEIFPFDKSGEIDNSGSSY
ncbi:hypothetical protein ACIGQ5_26380, partial [Peribacillus frigoritolerans]|uniref:hypothetical protein n=1 Tax=Peribacillus frigoritolerans TaxID=450367 RepID=UPI0037C79519